MKTPMPSWLKLMIFVWAALLVVILGFDAIQNFF
jgi:hypothetical protein